MKKSILTLLILFICAIQSSTAYEYFTIYFSDGTKSKAFYATDVDSICYSKLSLDSIAYNDWQVQEIYTYDSVYRYPLAQIDSLSFKDVDVDIVAEDINRASSVIIPLYAKYESAVDLSQHLSTIRNVEGVEDVWIDGQSLYVDIRDYGTITFIYPPKTSISDASRVRAMQMTASKSASYSAEHNQTDIGRVCIFNHMAKDNDPGFDDARWVVKELKEMYDKMGISCEVLDNVQADFFVKKMFDYDQLFIITHGEYDREKTKSHWLATDEEILCVKEGNYYDYKDKILEFLFKKALYSSYKLNIMSHKEIRNGVKYIVFYVAISDNLIASSKHHFQNPNTIVFNAACESMGKTLDILDNGEYKKEIDEKMSNTFINKGATCYIGYDDTNTIGRMGGFEFFQGLLNGSCIQKSFDLIDGVFQKEVLYKYEDSDELYREKLDGYFYEPFQYSPEIRIIKRNPNLCFLHPRTIDYEIISSDNWRTKIKAQIKKINSDAISVPALLGYTLRSLKDKYTYGFQYSKNSDLSGADDKKADSNNYDEATLYMNWEATLDEKDLQPNTTYYYRAYMNDGFSDCYGEIKQFTTGIPDNYEAYTVLTNDTITFYYDDKRIKSQGTICNRTSNGEKFLYLNYNKGWLYNIKTAKFDPSFANYYATNMSGSFAYCTNMTEIIDIKYLKTDSVTDMREMFSDCRSLKNIDLSHFNTSKVKDMSRMFYVCWSLNSLDLSSFNTSNVTDMSLMFYECRALVNLDLSSFNTTKVTNMHKMFECCNSLINLDLSSFNPINVTDMGYMFHECNSMTSLKFGNFNTANVTNMYEMFYNCKSLTSLDLSSFNTINVTNMTFMFHGCNSLTNLNLSSFNTSNVTDMAAMFYGCSSLTSLDLSSFNTSKSSGYGSFFSGCSSLHKIYVSSNWKQSPGTYMFYDCIKLEGGKGTKIGKNYYGSDDKGNPLYYNCGYDSSAAHIDGGKDWPGLFTTK